MRIVADGVHQVRLAQAHAAIDEQRVVRLGGHLRYRQGHRMRKPVAGAHHEGIKGILGVEQRQRIAGGAGLQRLEPVLELLVAVDLHRQGTSRRGTDRLLNLAHVTAGAHLLHHGAYALQQHRIPHQRAGLESRFNPGAVTDAGHLLLQNLAGASPQLLSLHHGAFNLPFLYIIQCLLWSVIHMVPSKDAKNVENALVENHTRHSTFRELS